MKWYEDDALWSGFADLMFSRQRAGETAEDVKNSVLLTFPADSRVLDLCCGPGLYLVPLARQGHRVTGVDLNAPMLARAAAACAEAGVEAELVEADMAEFVRPGGFDVVLNLYNSFGYFAEAEKNFQVLSTVHASLVPGGTFLMDVFGKEVLARRVARPQVIEIAQGTVTMNNTILDDWNRLRTEWTLHHDGTTHSRSITTFVYTAAGLRSLFEQAGFVDVECFGDFDGRPYDARAKRLVVRGRRA